MVHLIMISPDQTFSYREFPGSAPEIRAEILEGKNRSAITGFDPQVYCLAGIQIDVHIWNDWLVVLPVNQNVFLPGKKPLERRLSRRQLDVLLCLSEGMTGKQIALRLNIHTRSVSLHISALKRNLEANTAAECVQKAARLGILKTGG
jgi:DNA-binding CsgD family transcriptional regulator